MSSEGEVDGLRLDGDSDGRAVGRIEGALVGGDEGPLLGIKVGGELLLLLGRAVGMVGFVVRGKVGCRSLVGHAVGSPEGPQLPALLSAFGI